MTLVRVDTALALERLTDQALRVQAVQAASTYDTEGLALLTRAYMRGGSKKGARTSEKTLRAYDLAVRTFVPWAHEQGVQLLRPGRRDGGRYLAYLQDKPNAGRGRGPHLTPASIAQYLAGARALYRALCWAGACDAQPFGLVSAPADPTPGIVKNPPYATEIDAVLPHCDDRLRTLLLLCGHSGLRIGEALAVRIGDIQGSRLIVHGKGGKRRMVPLGRRIRDALNGLSPALGDAYFTWTYSQASHLMQAAFTAAGIGHHWRGFHAARKASGTQLYRATRDFTRVGLFLGHASVDTTRRYVSVPENDVSHEVEDF